MTNEQLLKYFKNRPKLKEVFLVGSVVFTDKVIAGKYAKQVGRKVEPKSKKEIAEGAKKEKEIQLSKEEAQAQLLDLDLTAENDNKVLRALAAALSLVPEEETTEAYLKVLAAEKSVLLNDGNDGQGGSGDDELTKEKAELILKGMDLTEDDDYGLLQDLVKVLELPHEGRSRAVYLEALRAYKASKDEGGTD